MAVFAALAGPAGASHDPTLLAMSKVRERVQMFELRYDRLPANLEEIYGDREVPTDAWGEPLRLEVPGPDGRPFDLVSHGSEGGGCLGSERARPELRLADVDRRWGHP